MIRRDTSPKGVRARDSYDAAKRAAQPGRVVRVTGYNHNSQAHEDARMLELSAERRSEIASMGGKARAATYGHAPYTGGELHPFPLGSKPRRRRPHFEAFLQQSPPDLQPPAAKTPAFLPPAAPDLPSSAPISPPPAPPAAKTTAAQKPQTKAARQSDDSKPTAAAIKAAAAARAAESRPARRKAARERKAAEQAAITKALRS